jgi:Zn-dependent protease
MEHVWSAAFTALALAVGLWVREAAKAGLAYRSGDLGVKLAGRFWPRLSATADPFGTYLLPGLILFLVLVGNPLLPPFAYAKPLEINARSLHGGTKRLVAVSLAGPVSNLILAAVAGLLLRLGLETSSPMWIGVYSFLVVNIYLAVLHLMPIPGLDGATLLALVLPPRPREVFTNLSPYLPSIILVAFFFLSGILLLPLVNELAASVCRLLAGAANCGLGV